MNCSECDAPATHYATDKLDATSTADRGQKRFEVLRWPYCERHAPEGAVPIVAPTTPARVTGEGTATGRFHVTDDQ